MRKTTRLALAFLIIIMLHACGIELYAQTEFHKQIPDLPTTPALVNDLGDMMSEEEELKLESKLLQYEKETSNEIAVVTVLNLGDMEVSEFALELGRKWSIGKSSKKNGVLLLASREDRKINISPGYGLQGVLPDITCSRIIREQIVPNFKNGNFYQGFDEATDKIMAYSKGEFKADEQPKEKKGLPKTVIILMILVIIIIFFMKNGGGGGTYMSRRGYKSRNTGWGGGWLGGGFGGFGGGGFGGGSGGGGFGGFGGGGGGFDGGGASGSW